MNFINTCAYIPKENTFSCMLYTNEVSDKQLIEFFGDTLLGIFGNQILVELISGGTKTVRHGTYIVKTKYSFIYYDEVEFFEKFVII